MESLVTSLARIRSAWQGLSFGATNGLLYLLSALFAGSLGLYSSEAAQWHWGFLSVIPYLAAGIVSLLALRKTTSARPHVVLALLLFVGSVAAPLTLEAQWRHLTPQSGWAQPEVDVIERSGGDVYHGTSPYEAYMLHGGLHGRVVGVPEYESFFPYFPLMSVFGLPRAIDHRATGLTDARIVMSSVSLLLLLLSLRWMRASMRMKIRVAQFIAILPTGALFLSTGGDDMPVLALSLLGLVCWQRRWLIRGSLAMATGAALKLTAWPLVFVSLWAIYRRSGVRKLLLSLGNIAGVFLFTVAPFAWQNPRAFLENVAAFPLGLSGVASPAASPLPGHLITSAFPVMKHILPIFILVLGGVVLSRHRRRHPIVTMADVLRITAISVLTIVCFASATRIGYVIYPVNVWLWSYVFTGELYEAGALVETQSPRHFA